MDDFKELIDNLVEIESIDKNYFKSIEINPDKIIYFIFHENQKIINGKITSASMAPVGFILKTRKEYYYCPLNDEKLDKSIIKEFIELNISSENISKN